MDPLVIVGCFYIAFFVVLGLLLIASGRRQQAMWDAAEGRRRAARRAS